MSNKGKKYVRCPECNRNRYCAHVLVDANTYKWTCSKGHQWNIKRGMLEKIKMMHLHFWLPLAPNYHNLYFCKHCRWLQEINWKEIEWALKKLKS